MAIDRGVRPFRVRTEERDGRLVLAISGDLDLETAGVVIAALDRAGDVVQGEVVLDLRDLSFIGPGRVRASVTDEGLAGVRGVPAPQADRAPGRRRRRRLPARCRSPGDWTGSPPRG